MIPDKQQMQFSEQANLPSALTVFLIFLKLGLTSFGGPVAHLGYFREEFVVRKKWLSEQAYADLVALCQFLPGPASSQVGIALGLGRSGYSGALAAWLGFTMPSALLLIFLALGLSAYHDFLPEGGIHGLKVVAVAVVIQAVWGMARNLCPDTTRLSLMGFAACGSLLMSGIGGQVAIIVISGVIGLYLYRNQPVPECRASHTGVFQPAKSISALALLVFFSLLIVLPFLSLWFPDTQLVLIDIFYRAGSLVFGGGHVVLPLLQAEVVPKGLVDENAFLAGYGAAQAVPGPLFTFSAFLGASMLPSEGAFLSGMLCLVAIFAPSFLLVIGVLPYWDVLRQHGRTQHALMGINAGVVGLLLAACYQPVWTSAILSPEDFCLGLLALLALMFWKLPPWLVVCLGFVLGATSATFF